MRKQIPFILAALFLMSAGVVQTNALRISSTQSTSSPKGDRKLNGSWRVKFALSGVEKNLILDVGSKGSGVLRLLDTGPDNQPFDHPLPATWSQLTNDRVSFSSEAELPIGTCCREMGTMIFKGKFSSNSTISGTIIFITGIDEEESPYKLHSVVGTFIGNRMN